MTLRFEANCLPCLIGSLPLTDYTCGMGTLSVGLTLKALRLTRELSNRIRNEQRVTRPRA